MPLIFVPHNSSLYCCQSTNLIVSCPCLKTLTVPFYLQDMYTLLGIEFKVCPLELQMERYLENWARGAHQKVCELCFMFSLFCWHFSACILLYHYNFYLGWIRRHLGKHGLYLSFSVWYREELYCRLWQDFNF